MPRLAKLDSLVSWLLVVVLPVAAATFTVAFWGLGLVIATIWPSYKTFC